MCVCVALTTPIIHCAFVNALRLCLSVRAACAERSSLDGIQEVSCSSCGLYMPLQKATTSQRKEVKPFCLFREQSVSENTFPALGSSVIRSASSLGSVRGKPLTSRVYSHELSTHSGTGAQLVPTAARYAATTYNHSRYVLAHTTHIK